MCSTCSAAAATCAGCSKGQGRMLKLKKIKACLRGEPVLPPDQHISLIYYWRAAGGRSGQGCCVVLTSI